MARGKAQSGPLLPNAPLVEWFWERVSKSPGCWIWTGSKTWKGYGEIAALRTRVRAHRLSWEIAKGPIPEGLFIDHVCHNKACVRPAHLRLATDGENKQNREGPQANSTTGIRGVSLDKNTGRYVARAKLHGRKRHLGCFATAEEAGEVARIWRLENMPYSNRDQAPTGAFFNVQTKETA